MDLLDYDRACLPKTVNSKAKRARLKKADWKEENRILTLHWILHAYIADDAQVLFQLWNHIVPST